MRIKDLPTDVEFNTDSGINKTDIDEEDLTNIEEEQN